MRDQIPLRLLLTLCGALLVLAAATACAGPREAAVNLDALLSGTQAPTAEQPPAAPTEVTQPRPTSAPRAEVVPVLDENCVNCHTNQEMLMTLATEAEEPLSTGEGWGSVPPMEAWEKVLISEEAVTTGVHAFISCTDCHGGNDVEDMEEAHVGLIADPSDAPTSVCGDCHTDVQAAHNGSLHQTLAGFDTALHQRSIPENHPVLDEMQANNCSSCHTSCGDCHISQPTIAGGGLLAGHQFVQEPPMTQTCTACHGSRVGNEYTGGNEGIPADVHFTQGEMTCVACHNGNEMHGQGLAVSHRFQGPRTPRCESCHEAALTVAAGIEEHTIHGQDVACQVCHSVEYTNCSSCHVQQTEDGVPYYEMDPPWMDFRIGLNTNRTPERPWQYILVRHVPIAPDSFDFYGENLLPNFNARPTWLETTPHNIQRVTPQAERCENCHGNPDIFLTLETVAEDELEANRSVIVSEPPSLTLLDQVQRAPQNEPQEPTSED